MSMLNSEWSSPGGSNEKVAVLQLTPSASVKLGADRFWTVPKSSSYLGADERDILLATDSHRGGIGDFVVVFNARDEERALWSIDSELDDLEADRVAERFLRGQLPLYRELLARRAIAFFSVGLSLRDAVLLRCASTRLSRLLGAASSTLAAEVGSDAWLMGRFAVFTSGRSAETLNNVLPKMANVLGRRGERARRQSREITGWVPPKPA